MLELPNFLTRDELGQIDLTGHRVGLEHIVYFHNLGETAEQLVDRFPSLGVGHVRRVLDFYREHREAVDAYVHECEVESDRLRAIHRGPTADQLRARMERRLARQA